jgi:hypothetical protein
MTRLGRLASRAAAPEFAAVTALFTANLVAKRPLIPPQTPAILFCLKEDAAGKAHSS